MEYLNWKFDGSTKFAMFVLVAAIVCIPTAGVGPLVYTVIALAIWYSISPSLFGPQR